MEDCTEFLQKFEESLKKSVNHKPLALYYGSKNKNELSLPSNHSYNPQEVLSNVSKQMQAIQKADTLSSCKVIPKRLNKYKKSTLMSLNMLRKNTEVPTTKQSNFETQFVSDTQLIDIVKNAEALINTNNDVTQEFEQTFSHNNGEVIVNIESTNSIQATESNRICVNNKNQDIDGSRESDLIISSVIQNKECSLSFKPNNENNNNVAMYETQMNDNCTEMLNKCMEIENLSAVNENKDIDIPLSYVFAPVRNSKTPSPLVFDLNTFENFEKLANPVIEEIGDIDSAKHFINSQILGRELVIKTNEFDCKLLNEQMSPVLKMNTEKLTLSSVDSNSESNSNNNKAQNSDVDLFESDPFLKDEILFSSDEESEYVHKEIQDLPLTCALETSFYNQVDMLDKTMYVGFQTASNQSIQVSTNSFTKAKSLLNGIEKDMSSKATFTELVDICDSLTKSNKVLVASDDVSDIEIDLSLKENLVGGIVLNDTREYFNKSQTLDIKNESKTYISRLTQNITTFKDSKADTENTNSELVFKNQLLPTKRKFEGFTTASNKRIKLSDVALARCKKVFQDIDLDQSFEGIKHINSKEYSKVEQQIDDDILKEFSNDMSLLDEKNGESTSDLVGLKTAGTSDIKISEDTLEKTKTVFQGKNVCESLDKDVSYSQTSCNIGTNADFIGFKTASNKPINISEQAVTKSRNIFKDIDVVEEIHVSDFTITGNKNNVDDSVGCDIFQKEYHECNQQQKIFNFVGFRTANNNEIKISDKALLKTKNLFKTILDNEKSELDDDVENCNRVSDKYASNDLAKVRKTQTEKYRDNKLINTDILDIKKHYSVNILKSDYANSTKIDEDLTAHKTVETFLSFKTASNNDVEVSQKSLHYSKKFFNDEFSKTNTIDKTEVDITLKDVSVLKGFQTASNKPVNVSAKALAKSKLLFKDIADFSTMNHDKSNEHEFLHEEPTKSKASIVDTNTDKSHNAIETLTEPLFKGFQTANKNPIKISAQALEKSKALFKDINDDNYTIDNSKDKLLNIKSYELPAITGFRTASKKPVQITAEALANSRALFKDIDDNNVISRKKTKELQKNEQDNEITPLKGFETEIKKQVLISPEAIENNDDVNVSNMKSRKDIQEYVPAFKGFQTANKKPVKISAAALAKSKALFQDIKKKDQNSLLDFETVNSIHVTESEEALTETKKLFHNKVNNEFKLEVKTQFAGFHTANNKKVNISEQALKKSRQLLQDIDFNNEEKNKNINTPETKVNYDNIKENIDNNKNKLSLFSFKTGNKNSVQISDDALTQSKKILNNFDYDHSNLEIRNKKVLKPLENNLEKLIDTQVLNNFEETLCTEDFHKDTTPRQSKRSGSPILSCPKAKKRKKFETPYSKGRIETPKTIKNVEIAKYDSEILFNDDYKKSKRYTLKELAAVENSTQSQNIDPYISKFTFENLLEFELSENRNELTNERCSIKEIKEIFLGAVNKKFIPDGWLDNHIKLIIWKLISYEIKFPTTLSKVCSVKNVLDQLKYRYNKELYNAERPALRKILEKDDIPSKTMILCVAGIYVVGVSVCSVTNIADNVELLLSDGWYCVKACIDKMLTKLVFDEKITVGSKIVTNGAELMNFEQGIAPWEDTSSVRLKIFGNSTRRARWDARLGYHGNGAMLTQLSSIRPEGGKVSRLRLFVTRAYPPLYVEKFEDGSTVTRSERLEHLHQIKYETDRQTAMEKLYEEVEKEISDEESQDSDGKRSLESGSQILGSHRNDKSHIAESQIKYYEDRSNKRRERILQDIQTRVQEKIAKCGLGVSRNVVPLMKARVAGVPGEGAGGITKGLMSIWKPNEAVTEIVREGAWIEVMNVVPTAVRYSEIQISAGRQSIFKQSKYKGSEKIKQYLELLKRICYPIRVLAKNPTMTTDYNEIDTVGFVFQIDPTITDFESSKQLFQNMYLADSERNLICVNFWGGIKKFGFQNILDTGQVVACMNLQKRAGNTKKNIPHYRATEFSYFTKTPKNVNTRNIVEELVKNISVLDKRKYCEECVALKNHYSVKLNTNNEFSPYRFDTHNLSKNKLFIDSPLIDIPKKDDNLNLTGLDFESTFKQSEPQELSPKSLLRKKRINDKIAKLKMYGEPPPLSPIHIINRSKSALNSFKSPLALKNEMSVASPNKTSDIGRNEVFSVIPSSPIIPMNRTYVKNMNPIKLNFSNVQETSVDDEVDHFAEDFDGSPPLSLD